VTGSVIRQRLARAAQRAAEGGPGADRAFRLAFARAARDTLALEAEVVSLSQDRRSLTELLDLPPDRALIALVAGPREALGLIAFSPQVLAAMIEAQTVGRVSTAEAPPRRPTRTDGAMVTGVIDRALSGLEGLLAEDADLVWAGGFRHASFLEDPRPLALLLEDAPFRVLTARVSLGGGAKTGEVLLALPAKGRGVCPAVQSAPLAEALAGPMFTKALAEQVQTAVTELHAVLHRVTVPLSAVLGLQAGDLLPLPMSAVEKVVLETLDGRKLASGKLGQNRGMRAVRLVPRADTAADGAAPLLRAVG